MSEHLLTLEPTDVLFFRDGRPMEGAATGHGAAWPLPSVLSSALHHALRRGLDLSEVHQHTPKRSGQELKPERSREFGSLKTAGPFPVQADGTWYFPRPVDAEASGQSRRTHAPAAAVPPGADSSLPGGLLPVVPSIAPSKDRPANWWSAEAWTGYLEGENTSNGFAHDDDFFAAEHNIGIGIEPGTQTQDGERFYSASYLRLKHGVRIGMIAECLDKGPNGESASNDLIARVFPNSGEGTHVLVGGQQRVCTVGREHAANLPLPIGPEIQGTRIRWTLLTPAIFPLLPVSDGNPTAHPGGWLPSWVHPENRRIQLKDPGASQRGSREGRKAWRERVAGLHPIDATLVAAAVPRAIPVTGWSLANDLQDGGPRATHLAVPAGSVYYFEAANEDEARKLAAALNWHGNTEGTAIKNRRSTLLGEKGFGLGVCSVWNPAQP